MQDPGYDFGELRKAEVELLRISLPRTPVNKSLSRGPRGKGLLHKREPEPLSKDSGLLPAPLGVALSKRVYSPQRGSVLQGVIVPSGSCTRARV